MKKEREKKWAVGTGMVEWNSGIVKGHCSCNSL